MLLAAADTIDVLRLLPVAEIVKPMLLAAAEKVKLELKDTATSVEVELDDAAELIWLDIDEAAADKEIEELELEATAEPVALDD